jgi:hypothetical protein
MENFEEIIKQYAVKKIVRGTEENSNPVVYWEPITRYKCKIREVGYIEPLVKMPRLAYKTHDITTPYGVFASASIASRELGMPASTISKRVREGKNGWYRNDTTLKR